MKFALTVILTFLAPSCLISETLEEIAIEALNTHPQICSHKKGYVASCELVRKARAEFMPQANVNYNTGYEEANNNSTRALLGGSSYFRREDATLFVGQTIFDGGHRSSTLKQKKADYCKSYSELREARESIAFRAAEAYLNVLRRGQIIKIYQEDVSSHVEMQEKVEKKVEGGAGRISEIQLAKSRLALARSRLLEAKAKFSEANNIFIEVIGRPPNIEEMSVPVLFSLGFDTIEEALQQAFCSNPKIAAAYANAESSRAQVGISRSALSPKLSFDITAFHGDDLNGVPGSNFLVNGLFAINWEFFTSGKIDSQIRSDRALYAQSLCDIENTKRLVENSVSTSFDFYIIDQERLVELSLHREISYEVFESYGKEFEVGARSLFDLLNSQIEFYNSRVAEVNGSFDVYTDVYRLLASMGELVNHVSYIYCER